MYISKNNEQFLRRFFFILAFILIGLSFIVSPVIETIIGLETIILSDDVLLTDYLEIAGLGGTLLNVGLVTLLTMTIIKKTDIVISGLTFSALFTLIGFSFFGKNVYNIIPIYLGVFLYSRYAQEPFKKYFTLAIFSTCLAPLIGSNFLNSYLGLLISAVIGVFYGFIIVPLASHVIRFHNGFTLFNVGFAGGLFALVISSVIRAFGIDLNVARYLSEQYHFILATLIVALSTFFFVLAYICSDFSISEYRRLTKKSGRAITDYFQLFKPGIVYFNVGVIGLFCLAIILFLKIPINGPIFGATLTIMGFATFGVSPLNAIPVVLGCVGMFLITPSTVETEHVLMALFVMGIAPIAGHYGFFVGLVAGALHYSVVSYSASWQGALNLYNNGFASGLVAGIVVSVLDNFKKVD